MLECGYPSPYQAAQWAVGKPVIQEEFALMYLCMRSSGFVFDKGKYDFCAKSKDLKGCQPGAAAPRRDIEKRIKGRFCHAHSEEDVCQR